MPRNRANRRRADSTTGAGSSSAALPPRSKAGCWTCRIRRKRCDEVQDDSGACQACNRLSIECLGWGTRRPDWCRDKDRLAQYKLDLKRKLCSRAGTRPSANNNKSAGSHSTSARVEYNDVKRAPSGESPRTGSDSSVEGDEDLETDDYTTTPFTPASALPTDSPLLFTPHSPFVQLPMQFPQYTKFKSTPLTTIAPKLRHLLVNARVPTGYASVLSQLLDLYALKANAFSEQEIARRAQAIEVELNKLSHRQSFDDLFSSALGFNFDPTSFLSAQSNGFGMDAQYASPMTMWSPDLMSDGMSTFSGSSAPTSPAAPLLGMTSNFNDFLGFDVSAPQQQTFDQSFGTFQSFSSPVQQPMTALGLTNDFLFPEASSFGPAVAAPAISLFPPTRSGSLDVDLMPSKSSAPPPVPAPAVVTTTASSSHDADPFQIHHETCSLLLQAVLSSEESPLSSFDMGNSYGLESLPLEESMQRLIGKFQSLQGRVLAPEYAFSATLAGALSTSQNRRAFFLNIVKGIERTNGMMGSSLLGEAWAL